MEKIKDKKNNKDTKTDKSKRRILNGEVVSAKMRDTAVVLVKRFVKHPKYGKYRTISKRYQTHNKNNEAQVGDKVKIEECKPISKKKRFRIQKKYK